MNIFYHKRFLKHYRKRIFANPSLVKRYEENIRIFFQNSNSAVLQDHALTGDLEGYRAFSVTGDFRVVYFKEKDTLHLYDIGTHNQVY